MSKVFCTIITRSHLSWALALLDSLRQFDADQPFCILITDVDRIEEQAIQDLKDVEVLFLKDLMHVELGRSIAAKYSEQSDELRWSLKPVLMQHLLTRHDKVVYGDCDLHFYNDPIGLWDELDRSDMLLTPHWRSGRAVVDRANFDLLFVGGLYNAGFVAAHRRATEPLRFWAENCLEVCVKDFTKGQYVDQTHLNLLPIYFEHIQVLKHRGCNVANWNMIECERKTDANGEVFINGAHPIIFIHFTRSMIDGIVSGSDGLLLPHLNKLRDSLLRSGHGTDIVAASRERLEEKERSSPKSNVQQRIGRAVKRITGGR